MKKTLIALFSVILAVSLFGGAFSASADEIVTEEITPAQLVEIFISLGIIAPEQAAQAQAALASFDGPQEILLGAN